MQRRQAAVVPFSAGLIGLGLLALIYGDFAMGWQPVATWVPGRIFLAYGSGVVMLLGGIGLLSRRTRHLSVLVLFPYLLLWMLLKIPALFVAPKIEGVWLGEGEIAVLFCAGWAIFAHEVTLPKLRIFSGERGRLAVRLLFGLSLIPIGLAHLMYPKETVALIPTWLPYPNLCAQLTGYAQIACGVAALAGLIRIAALMEAAMVFLFTCVVWGSSIVASPKSRLSWTAFWFSWFFAASAWIVAECATHKSEFQESTLSAKSPSGR